MTLEDAFALVCRLHGTKGSIPVEHVPDMAAFAMLWWARSRQRAADRPARRKGAEKANRDRIDRTDELLASFEAWRRKTNPVLSLRAAARAFFVDPDTDPDWGERTHEERDRMINNLLRSRRRR